MNTQHAEQTGDDNPLNVLTRIEPGYIEITRPGGTVEYLLVNDFKIGPNFVVSVGFSSDRINEEGNLGRPVFLHKRMQIRHLGTAAKYLEDPFVQRVIAQLEQTYPAEKELMPLLRTVEMVRSGRTLLADAPALLSALRD